MWFCNGGLNTVGDVQGTRRLLDPGRLEQRGHRPSQELHRGKQSNWFPWETLQMCGRGPQSPDVWQGHVTI
jgi:hypothetical protein